MHSYIVCGADAGARERLAFHIAKTALCGGKNSPCGVCAHCKKAEVHAHPDLHEYSPDGAEIKIAQAREARDAARIKPNEAETQVFVFHEAEKMNANAQNALLATIEEPPTNSVFIFVAENERALLPTVRSRSALVRADGGAGADEPSGAAAAARALCGALGADASAEALVDFAKLKGEAASDFLSAARRECVLAAARAGAGSAECARALAGAELAEKGLDMLGANVSAAQVAAYILASA